MLEKIGIVGGGWYGCHLALELSKQGYQVTLFEKNSDIFSGVSGRFGIRLHEGPHYPRSAGTRAACRRGAELFREAYPELVNEHEYSIYGLGTVDASGQPSKVTAETFRSVCQESKSFQEVEPAAMGYDNLLMAVDFDEPSIKLGTHLQNFFKDKLKEAKVDVRCGVNVMAAVLREDGKTDVVSQDQGIETVDRVINATACQSLLPPAEELPCEMRIKYQPCLALSYEDTAPSEKPVSLIVMDGWFPCLMPYDDGSAASSNSGEVKKYIVTHGSWTIVGSFDSAAAANAKLAEIDEAYIEKIKPFCEFEMLRFWPEFEKKFEFKGHLGAVIPKIMTDKEFRSAVTFADPQGIIHIIPGKVSNIFDASNEVQALLRKEHVLADPRGYEYVQDGILDIAASEITEKPYDMARNTCGLQTSTQLEQWIKRSGSPPVPRHHGASFLFWQEAPISLYEAEDTSDSVKKENTAPSRVSSPKPV